MSQQIDQLQILLASYSVFNQNIRHLHWYIKGKQFFVLHEKFEQLYEDLSKKIDDIAELILTLEYQPETSFSTYLKTSQIEEVKGEVNDENAVAIVIKGLMTLVDLQEALMNNAKDENILGLMSDNIRHQNKQVWMYKAYCA